MALFQYTGGTTGLPKAAMLTHRNLVCNTLQVASWLTSGVPGGEKMMAAIPFFHVYGMTVGMVYAVYTGAEMVIVPNPRPIDNVMNIIQKERCTIFPGVPAMYIGIVNHPNVAKLRSALDQGMYQRLGAAADGDPGALWADHRRQAGRGLWDDRGIARDPL